MTYICLQQYWWLLISVLGALLVFLMFVQGGQTMLLHRHTPERREALIAVLAPKWELTFTTLVTFGGAFFASFPLFYSTSFGGAYWVWMLILFGFILQAVSYKYRSGAGNVLGRKTYDAFLVINGLLAPVLLGGAVSTFFFGSDFTVAKTQLLDPASPVISQWGSLHGLEVLGNWRVVTFGLMVLFLTRTQANLWLINQTDDEALCAWSRRTLRSNAAIFVVLFLVAVGVLLTAAGYRTLDTHQFALEDYKYLHNFLAMPTALCCFLVGTVLVLTAIGLTLWRPQYKRGIWLSGLGTVLVVLALFWVAGYNDTPYYPSATDPASSLTIYNSSSSEFTLRTMAYVSIAIPFVLAYIAWVWRKLSNHSS